MLEGPRAVRQEEMGELRDLLGTAFRPTMMDEYPNLFYAENRENLRVCLEDGRCVSHVGMKQQGALLYGCRIEVACLGAVATDPAYRNRGLASACLDDAMDKACLDGMDVMLVSGNRPLYRSRDCMSIGSDLAFHWTLDRVASLEATASPVTVSPFSESDLPHIRDCYRNEPVRFFREPADFEYALNSELVRKRLGSFWVIREGNAFRGYVLLHTSGEAPKGWVVECAGERRALLHGFAALLDEAQLCSVHWEVPRHDQLFVSLCTQAGLEGCPQSTRGTLRLLHFPRLMERLRPYWQESLGMDEAAKLSFHQQNGECCFRYGEQELIVSRNIATNLLFGSVNGEEWEALSETGAQQAMWTALFKRIFPLPCLRYGLNYV